ncbi:hypothetical protein B4065_3566 [Caldibacillus thermoamylovorans]|uniref:Secreted protein n=1 Tax=Caldibacillus thermoamylovorans TaxID=35841 RepID=A0ABD4A7Q2_9BACI|nr:hypothetical protein B4065_3566 [Caldibacillus thermoamylovorans]KIO63631.1 hypothetical protein B4166_0277 [Caldibacillus thermoamylovorans]KIO72963.1 hypothetical protein B4167_0284 [Caldibacillus thermoamylovorans]
MNIDRTFSIFLNIYIYSFINNFYKSITLYYTIYIISVTRTKYTAIIIFVIFMIKYL